MMLKTNFTIITIYQACQYTKEVQELNRDKKLWRTIIIYIMHIEEGINL